MFASVGKVEEMVEKRNQNNRNTIITALGQVTHSKLKTELKLQVIFHNNSISLKRIKFLEQ